MQVFRIQVPIIARKQFHTNKPKLYTRKTLHESHIHCHTLTTETNSKVHAFWLDNLCLNIWTIYLTLTFWNAASLWAWCILH